MLAPDYPSNQTAHYLGALMLTAVLAALSALSVAVERAERTAPKLPVVGNYE